MRGIMWHRLKESEISGIGIGEINNEKRSSESMAQRISVRQPALMRKQQRIVAAAAAAQWLMRRNGIIELKMAKSGAPRRSWRKRRWRNSSAAAA